MGSCQNGSLPINRPSGDSGGFLYSCEIRPNEIYHLSGLGDPRAFLEYYLLQKKRSTMDGVDPRRIEQAGWGAVFPAHPVCREAYSRIRAALSPLLKLRKKHAGELFRLFWGDGSEDEGATDIGYLPNETSQGFLKRFSAAPGPVDPKAVPYYLLLVGGPDEIPFSFQTYLSARYAVGRLHFDQVEAYETYAVSVMAYETRKVRKHSPKLTLFGPSASNDLLSVKSSEMLVGGLDKVLPEGASRRGYTGRAATREQFRQLLGGGETPDILFSASHGVSWKRGHPKQRCHQGSLLCADWPGEGYGICHDHLFGADDVLPDGNLAGLICFFFACFSLGTPRYSSFSFTEYGQGKWISEPPFVSRLPQHLLSHPRGGALAVIGHIDAALGRSFEWGGKTYITTFLDCLKRLCAGWPIGYALQPFSIRFMELNMQIAELREAAQQFPQANFLPEIKHLSEAALDTRNYALLGDPGVRLRPMS